MAKQTKVVKEQKYNGIAEYTQDHGTAKKGDKRPMAESTYLALKAHKIVK